MRCVQGSRNSIEAARSARPDAAAAALRYTRPMDLKPTSSKLQRWWRA
ncbi:hypothetical protein BST28156_02298 [Burkholderia stagnalis]|nr:hypothetical protein BST28156_02298 [Burkholderia stagnalis]